MALGSGTISSGTSGVEVMLPSPPSPPPPLSPSPPVAAAVAVWAGEADTSLAFPPSCWAEEEEEGGRGGRGEVPLLLALVPTSSIVWYIVVAAGRSTIVVLTGEEILRNHQKLTSQETYALKDCGYLVVFLSLSISRVVPNPRASLS